MSEPKKLPAWVARLDRAIALLSPRWGRARAQDRLIARHYEAASSGRRTSGWHRKTTDANAAASGATLAYLRAQARDLTRNNRWAKRGLRRVTGRTVGWGIRPKPRGGGAERIMEAWEQWAETTQCDAAGRLTMYGLQRLVMRTVVESGECLVRRRRRRPEDGLAVPLQLQILEPDHIDTSMDGVIGPSGGKIVQGVEFDLLGRRVAYWLFDEHPGGHFATAVSKRVLAEGILHVYLQERPGQVRGPSWFAPVDVALHDFDEYEDATIMKQKIASCLAAFVTDVEGTGAPLGGDGTDARTGAPLDTMEPGMILSLPVGREVTMASPPAVNDHQSFSATTLRGIAAGLGTTYEDLTGDYSQVNYSSARMARIASEDDITEWRWDMLIPQFCAPTWMWMLEAMQLAGEGVELKAAQWTPPPLAMLDPDRDAKANTARVRGGMLTLDEMIREQGYDPDEFWEEYDAGLKRLDRLGIVLDCDPRKTTAAGQLQAPSSPSSSGGGPAGDKEPQKPPESAEDPATEPKGDDADGGGDSAPP